MASSADKSNRELLFSVTARDLEWEYFRTGGKGGQAQNKTSNGARVHHRPSGAVGESREERSQLQNRRAALKRMTEHPRFTFWVHERVKELDSGKTAEQRVDEQMAPENLKVEVKDENGRWVDDEKE